MSFFDDEGDPFDTLLRDFFGDSGRRYNRSRGGIAQGEEEEREIDFIETEKKVYLIFEIPLFNDKSVKIEVKGKEIEIVCKSKGINSQNYLSKKIEQGFHIKKTLPNFIKTKDFKHTFNNGILEVVFDKKL